MEEVFSDDQILRNDSMGCHFTGAAFSHKNRRCSLRLDGVSYSIGIQAKKQGKCVVHIELNEEIEYIDYCILLLIDNSFELIINFDSNTDCRRL